ncbi:dihydrolipoyl dehydrogenase [Candidatus Micrarchaeota archaeon]|nr:dihydrolipoyl dehydrogenase [Candidatus Micrarchaeota archaeon]
MVMGQLSTETDLVIIGAGPGGYTAAIRAAQLGLDVLLVEKNYFGGTCTNVGCIPSKAMIHAADVKFEAESDWAKEMGIDAKIALNFAQTKKWRDNVVLELRKGIETLCKLRGVDTLKGEAFFTSSNTLSVETETGIRAVTFKKAIIATGTKIKAIPNLPYDHQKIISSDDVFSLTELPKNLIVVGGGYIAVEMANLFMKLGSNVTLIHRGDRLLKTMEPEITEILHRMMSEYGTSMLLNSEITKTDGNIAYVRTPEGEKKIEFDKILVAAGRSPNLANLNLDKTKVTLNSDGLITVNKSMQTTDENIFAIGDIVPGPQLAHKAFKEGKVAAEAISGLKSEFDTLAIPMVVFSDPEIAVVGLSEKEAIDRGYKVKVGKMPFSASGKARSINKTDGFVKIVSTSEGVILGVHIVGYGAGNLIGEGTLAIEMAALLEDLAATIHPHPTLPEALGEAAEDALGTVIHLYRGKK